MEKIKVYLRQGNNRPNDLYFSFCGKSQTFAEHTYGPNTIEDYSIHIILDGVGTFLSGKEKITVSKNQAFILKPGVPFLYQSSKEHPWNYIWMGFNGTLAEKLVHDIGIEDTFVFELEDTEGFPELIETAFQSVNNTVLNEIKLTGLTYQFLGLVGERITNSYKYESEIIDSRIPAILDYIHTHFHEEITVTDISEAMFLSREHLSRIFKDSLNISIKK